MPALKYSRGEGSEHSLRFTRVPSFVGFDLGGGRHMEHPVEAVVELVDASVHEGQAVNRHLGHRDPSGPLGGGPTVCHRLVRPQLDDDVEEVTPSWLATRSGWRSYRAGCFEGGPLPLDDVGNDVGVAGVFLSVLEVAEAVRPVGVPTVGAA